MSLTYGDINGFVRQHGDVKAFAEKSTLTLLRNGEIDSVSFWEEDAMRFEHDGKSYSRDEFERLVRHAKERT